MDDPGFDLQKTSGAYIAQKRMIGRFAQIDSETGIIVAIISFQLASSLPASKISLSNDSL
jgi:hypothetical protein